LDLSRKFSFANAKNRLIWENFGSRFAFFETLLKERKQKSGF